MFVLAKGLFVLKPASILVRETSIVNRKGSVCGGDFQFRVRGERVKDIMYIVLL